MDDQDLGRPQVIVIIIIVAKILFDKVITIIIIIIQYVILDVRKSTTPFTKNEFMERFMDEWTY